MTGLICFPHLRAALQLRDFNSGLARQRMAPVPRGWRGRAHEPKMAAVLLLVYPERDGRLHLTLTRRQAGLRGHSGQISFPGGRQDAHDQDLIATALRETCEEIGVCGDAIEVLGTLPSFYIPVSQYDVSPTVARCQVKPAFAANPAEVAEIFSFALDDLLQDRFKFEEWRRIEGYDVRVPYYAVAGHKVWGATAIMLSELEARLRAALPADILLELA